MKQLTGQRDYSTLERPMRAGVLHGCTMKNSPVFSVLPHIHIGLHFRGLKVFLCVLSEVGGN